MRRVTISASLAVGLLVLMSATTLAARPVEHHVGYVDDTFDEELCGIAVTTRVQAHENIFIYEDGRFVDRSQVTVTWTNEDGEWLTTSSAGTRTVGEVESDGTLTITESHVGVQSRLRSSDGITAAFDRGRIGFVTVIDLNDPEDPEDDVVVSSDVVDVAGPHPEADSDFALFCEVVTDVLG